MFFLSKRELGASVDDEMSTPRGEQGSVPCPTPYIQMNDTLQTRDDYLILFPDAICTCYRQPW
jgi:hypothetical protein